MHSKPLKIGIIGGGQLARMLLIKCQQLGLHTSILSGSKFDPAAQITNEWHCGDVNDLATLKSFLEKLDFATFESEFLDSEKLQLAGQFSQTKLFPDPKTMGRLQNRKTQKALLDEFKIEVAPWIFVEHEFQAQEILATLNSKLILKKCRFGYDGYGTFVIHSTEQLQPIFKNPSADGYIAEAKINFKRELAFMMARDQFNNIVSLPLVESFQKDAKCLWIKGPVQHKGFKKLEKQLKKMLSKLNYVGVMGVELFDCGNYLMVNELAPRVHNSGHYSSDALVHDQFLLHVMAVAGLKLPKLVSQKSKGFAMHNLLGENWSAKWAEYDLYFHWYGKSEVKPGRKMGHITALDHSPETALQKLLKAKRRVSMESK